VRGIDVSDHQTEIDWQAVADSGIEFAIIRCGWRGYSGGSLNEDTTFRQNMEGAKAAGLKVGVYFFSQATSMVEGAEEAIFALNLLEGYSLDLPVFFDWEEIGVESARTDNVSGETVTAAALEFCRLVESAGYDSGIYAYLNLAYFTYDLNQLEGITIWMGNPGSAPEFYYDHTYWQYSFTGSVDGIQGDVDLDVIFRRTTPLVVDVSESVAQEEQG
jgi:GH25 family lysozyme M1 (1,4-beta-N-acetylmuramidase)